MCAAGLQDTKVVRKRQKRLQLANQAAEDEMAEISIELQVRYKSADSVVCQTSRRRFN